MPRLNSMERLNFSAAQLVEIDRMSDRRQNAFLEPEDIEPQERAAFRAKTIERWKNQTAEQLKMRVNIDSFGKTVTYSEDDNYTSDERSAINAGWKWNRGRKAVDEIPAILSEYAALQSDGFSAAQALGILRNR